MKNLIIIFALVTALLLTVIFLGSYELNQVNKLQQKEIDGMRKRNREQEKAYQKELKLTRDSLSIAFHTIRLAKEETQKAHEQSQKEIKKLLGIVHVTYANDSLRLHALRTLYPTLNP